MIMIFNKFTVSLILILMSTAGCITKQTEIQSDDEFESMDRAESLAEDDIRVNVVDEGVVEENDVDQTSDRDGEPTSVDVFDQNLPSDMGLEDLDVLVEINTRCVNACSEVVDCLREECSETPMGNYAECVNACTVGTLKLDEIESVSCDDLKIWACEGPFAGECDCRIDGCEQSCQNVLQCLDLICESEVFNLESCIEYCEESPSNFENIGLNSVACEEVQRGICPQVSDVCSGCPQRDPDTFNLGSSCNRDADCQAGELQPYCIPATDPNAADTGWSGGYCTGIQCNEGDCGPNGICVGINDMGQTACLSLCGEELPDCRTGYGCEDLGSRNLLACIPY
jgi:hypothetical protein